MFRDRVREILSTIDYDLWEIDSKAITVSDRKNKGPRMVIDWMELPCKELSAGQNRSFACKYDKNSKFVNARYTNIDNSGYTSFLDISSAQNKFADLYSCSIEDDGKMYSIVVGNNGCKFREMMVLDRYPLLTELKYDAHKIEVSKSYNGESESIKLLDNGELSFYKNGELLEETIVGNDKNTNNINLYFSSVVSTVDSIVENSMSCLYEINPRLVKLMTTEFPILKRLFEHRSNCYETDFIDNYLRKHDIFIHDMHKKNVK